MESADRFHVRSDPFDSLAAAARARQGLYDALIDMEEWPEAQQRPQERAGRADSPASAEVLERVEKKNHAGARNQIFR